MKVHIEGLREVQSALRELPDATAKNVVRRVLKKRAQPVAETAKNLVRVGQGNLQESIGVSTKLSRRQKSLHRKKNRDDIEMFVGTGTNPQSITEEFGTYNQEPHPYMRPAWDKEKMGVLEGIADDMWNEISKAAARIARKLAKAR